MLYHLSGTSGVEVVLPPRRKALVSTHRWGLAEQNDLWCCVQVEVIQIDKDSLTQLGQIAESTSLRHAVQLLTPAAMMAKTNGRDGILLSDLGDVSSLFHDAKYSAKLLAEQADKYVS